MLKSAQLLVVATVFILVAVPLTIYLGLRSDENARDPQASTVCTTNCNSTKTTVSNAEKPQDLNNDGKVNGADLAIFQTKLGKADYPAADFNSDGKVDTADQAILVASWSK